MKTKLKLPDGLDYGFDGEGNRICRGAKHGRVTLYPVDRNVTLKFRLARIPIDSQGYDPAGAYWGLGQRLYWAVSDEEVATQWRTTWNTEREEQSQMFVRARDREEAKQLVRKEVPNAKFYR